MKCKGIPLSLNLHCKVTNLKLQSCLYQKQWVGLSLKWSLNGDSNFWSNLRCALAPEMNLSRKVLTVLPIYEALHASHDNS